MLIPPDELQRNALPITAAGYDETGEGLIRLAGERLGVPNFADLDVLDVGCGVRFAAAIVNRGIPIRSYTGIEVYRPIVDFLNTSLAGDPRFRFRHWNARNAMYNPEGTGLAELQLPVDGAFDAIWMFSVVTHLEPADTLALLAKLRDRTRAGGKLLFSAFVADEIAEFENRGDFDLHMAYYNQAYLTDIVAQAGWRIESVHPRDPTRFIRDHFVCSVPAAV